MKDIKQVIVVRTDLNMRKGKMCSQVAHASMKVFFDRMSYMPEVQMYNNGKVIKHYSLMGDAESPLIQWMEGYIK